MRPPEGPPQLFDLSVDPQEMRDLARERPAERQALEESLGRLKKTLGGVPARSPHPLSPDALRSLKALGYID